MQYRQGDVLLVAVPEIPTDAKLVQQDGSRVILALGEATGHHHSFAAGAAALFRPDDMPGGMGGYVAVAGGDALLTHQEHDAIAIPAGLYVQAIQVEETPEAVRRVED